MTAVLVIWGILGFKIVNTIGPDTSGPQSIITLEKFVPPHSIMKDTFSIVADYRDPFLGTLPKREQPAKPNPKLPKKDKLPEKNISYTGFVTESTSGKKVFFISIDGKQLMMSLTEVQNGVKLVSGNKSKIKVQYQGHLKTISLAE